MHGNSSQDGEGDVWPGQAWWSRFAGARQSQRAGQGWVRESPASIASPHFPRLCDLRDLDFAKGKLSYRGRRRRRWCKLFTFQCLFAIPWTLVHQAPLSMGLSRQEYPSELSFPPPGDLPKPGVEPASPVSPCFDRRVLYECATWEDYFIFPRCIMSLLIVLGSAYVLLWLISSLPS